MTPNPARYRASRWLLPLGLLTTAFASPAAFADLQTKITSINGSYSTYHDAQLTVQPGDTISLVADEVDTDYDGNLVAQNKNVEDFTWSSDASSSDSCDPEYDCSTSNFEVTQYGVSYYVPFNFGASATITVQNRADGTYDQLTLVNGSAGLADSAPAPTTSYSDSADYDGDFDYNRALVGHGRWVYIDGERIFVPYGYQADWQPYQNGYWYWTEYGWTWQSYDPWGWVTDHYGCWRHHGVYGWVWRPFEEVRWYPATVTFFHTDEGIGWYPYYNGYARAYAHGYASGYDDGFWDGYRAGLAANYRWGATYVYNRDFAGGNCYDHRVRGVNVYNVYQTSYYANRYGPVLVSTSYRNPREFVEARIGRTVVATPINVVARGVIGGGRVQFVRPAAPVVVPAQYRQVAEQHSRIVVGAPGARIPVGTVINHGGIVSRPSRPVVVAPRVPNGNGGYTSMPPRNRVPVSQPRPANPAPSRPSFPTPSRPSNPVPSRPSYPTPAPSRPSNPVPSRPTYPTPSRPSNPAPSRPSNPAPSRPSYPAPSRPSNPAPSRPSYPAPSRPSNPAPSRPSYPAPSRPSNPAPSRPSYPAPSRPSNPAPSRPSYPAPSRPSYPSPAPSRPSYPSPAPSRPSYPAPSRPSPAPSRPGRR